MLRLEQRFSFCPECSEAGYLPSAVRLRNSIDNPDAFHCPKCGFVKLWNEMTGFERFRAVSGYTRMDRGELDICLQEEVREWVLAEHPKMELTQLELIRHATRLHFGELPRLGIRELGLIDLWRYRAAAWEYIELPGIMLPCAGSRRRLKAALENVGLKLEEDSYLNGYVTRMLTWAGA